jgi:hypothetical protein
MVEGQCGAELGMIGRNSETMSGDCWISGDKRDLMPFCLEEGGDGSFCSSNSCNAKDMNLHMLRKRKAFNHLEGT